MLFCKTLLDKENLTIILYSYFSVLVSIGCYATA